MKIFPYAKAGSERKFPGIYRDRRDGEVILAVTHNMVMVLKHGDGSIPRTKEEIRFGPVGQYDDLFDGSFVISND